jgi:hypothetical protein
MMNAGAGSSFSAQLVGDARGDSPIVYLFPLYW